MDKIKLIKRIIRWTVLIIGFVLVLGGAYGLDYLESIKKQYVPVTGIIKEIKRFQEYNHGKKYNHYEITVHYLTQQGNRDTKLSIHTAGMKVGKEIAIWYNPDNPDEICAAEERNFLFLALILAGILLLVSGWFIVPPLLRKMGQHSTLPPSPGANVFGAS